MSDKLTRLDINNNVELYPCITEQKRKELFERCDIYLDINHYRELYNAVNEAMVNNMIILAFDNTGYQYYGFNGKEAIKTISCKSSYG